MKNIYTPRTRLKWCFFIAFLLLLAVITPEKYTIAFYPAIVNDRIKLFGNIINIFSLLTILFFILYYENKVLEITNSNTKADKEPIYDDNDDKYIVIFNKIEEYLKEDEPWKDPEFNVNDLAFAINSNSAYVSRSINLCAKMNFKTLINKYRIDYIKNELQTNDQYNRYTLVYLYTNAGFKQQTTFNKVFKQFEGMTPSEYINRSQTLVK